MADVSLLELENHLVALSSGGLKQLLRGVMAPATREVEEAARGNIQTRMTMRSRSLLTTLRSGLEERADDVVGTVSVGGAYGGLDVAYAHLQEDGGEVRPVNQKHLAIPVDAGLTGPGIPRYRSVRQMPFAAFRPARGPKLRWIVYDKRNDQVFFLLVTSVSVPGKHYLRDALAPVYADLPRRLLDAARAGVEA